MDRVTRGDPLDLPWSPAGRETHKWAVIKVVASLVPDGVVERRSDDTTASFIATSIRPILPILHKYRKTRFSAHSILLCQHRHGNIANYRFVLMIGTPPGQIEASFELDKLRMHNWLRKGYQIVIG